MGTEDKQLRNQILGWSAKALVLFAVFGAAIYIIAGGQ